MKLRGKLWCGATLGAALVFPAALRGDVVTLTASADTFILSTSPTANAGGNGWFDAGTDGQPTPGVRRGLLRFDLSAIPAGSTITSAVLRLTVTKLPGGGGAAAASTVGLFRLNAGWGEGTKAGPNGTDSTAGEATWNARLAGTANWTAPGAASDAGLTASASTDVGFSGGTLSWSGLGMRADVQGWVDNPAGNFGWLVRSFDESNSRSVRGFGSKESPSGPRLEVGYTPANAPQPPAVAVVSPANEAAFANPATVTLVAEATSTGSAVTNVVFFEGQLLLGRAAASPWSFTTNFLSGPHAVYAVATDARGLSTNSATITFTVTNVVIANPIAARIAKADKVVELRTIADGMASPVALVTPNDNSGRMFVADQDGRVHVITANGRLSAPLLDVRHRLVLLGAFDERGLLGLASHPDFANQPFIYTYTSETNSGPADFPTGITNNHQSVIAEWRVSAANSNQVDLASRREILRIDEPQSNHNGGAMRFGPDGFLYVTLGDGGSANDVAAGHSPGGNAQDLTKILGKLIRIDVRGTNSANGQYGIPQDNPFVGMTNALPEIFAYGLRNPFTFSFDKNTGQLYLADVGQNKVEEINIILKGGNYGWNVREGTFWFDGTPGSPTLGNVVTEPVRSVPPNLVEPIAQYDHDDGLAVIGGFVYRGSALPALAGRYVFGDWGSFAVPSGRLYYLDTTNGVNELIVGGDDRPLGQWLKGFGEGPDGELYALTTRMLGPSGNTGRLLKIVPAGEPIVLTEISSTNSSTATLAWSGGRGPFVVDKKSSLEQRTWSAAAVRLPANATVNNDTAMGFFRVTEAAHIPPVPFTVYMSGGGERAPNNSAGIGFGIFALDGNTLGFNIRYSGLSGAAMAGHIHGPVDTSTNASVLIDLAPYNGGGWGASGELSGVLVLNDTQKAHLLGGKTYVNLHTPTFPNGEIRGQIAPVNMQAELRGDAVGTNAPAYGLANITLVGNELTFNVTYRGLSGTATLAHFHGPAGPTQNASPILDLAAFNGGAWGASGAISGSATLTPERLAWLIDGLIYINIHTAARPGGEIRGQALPRPTGVPLTSALAAPPTLTNSATGDGTFSLDGNTLVFNLRYSGLSAPATMAHIHGPAGATNNAPVLIDLLPYAGGGYGQAGTLSGSIPLTTSQRNLILGGQTYVNFHTPANPGGEMRGQIAPVLMWAALSGNNEVPAAATTGSGYGTFALVRDRLAVAVTYRNLLSPATMSHIHGPAGFFGNAGVLQDLESLNGGSYGSSGSLSGTVTLTRPKLLNVIDASTYVNFHTTNYTGGEIRGHIMR